VRDENVRIYKKSFSNLLQFKKDVSDSQSSALKSYKYFAIIVLIVQLEVENKIIIVLFVFT